MKKASSKNKRAGARKIWIPIVLILLAVAGGAGYIYWKQQTSQEQAAHSQWYRLQHLIRLHRS